MKIGKGPWAITFIFITNYDKKCLLLTRIKEIFALMVERHKKKILQFANCSSFHSYSNNTPKINSFSSTKTFPAVIFLSFVTVMFEKIGT